MVDVSFKLGNGDGYKLGLNRIREYVNNKGSDEDIKFTHEGGTTTLSMTRKNFLVTKINGNAINYNYTGEVPSLKSTDFYHFPIKNSKPTDAQKTKLLYLFPEAARSIVIEEAITSVINENLASLDLNQFTPLVKAYAHTCETAEINSQHPSRPLEAEDYRNYVEKKLDENNPDRIAITILLDALHP